MKFQITYRLTHPEYLPVIAHATISAHTHQQLDAELTKLTSKWKAQGYTVRILAISKRLPFKQSQR
jgi:hypothetical protein